MPDKKKKPATKKKVVPVAAPNRSSAIMKANKKKGMKAVAKPLKRTASIKAVARPLKFKY
jgi:hypothetical protein